MLSALLCGYRNKIMTKPFCEINTYAHSNIAHNIKQHVRHRFSESALLNAQTQQKLNLFPYTLYWLNGLSFLLRFNNVVMSCQCT